MKKDKKGFTLIEILIVLAIIACFAAIIIPAFNKHIDNNKGISAPNHIKIERSTQDYDRNNK